MLKISYPINPLSSLLINENSMENKNINFFNGNDKEPLRMLEQNHSDISLLTLDQYAAIKKDSDIRIIPHSCLVIDGMSAKLALKSNGFNTLDTFKNKTDIEFFSIVLKLLYRERYQTNLQESDKADIELEISNEQAMFDLTEDWQDSFKIGLPIYIWCARYEDGELGLETISENLNQIVNFKEEKINIDGREGIIVKKWSDRVEKEIDNTLELLFYQGFVSELFDAKLYN